MVSTDKRYQDFAREARRDLGLSTGDFRPGAGGVMKVHGTGYKGSLTDDERRQLSALAADYGLDMQMRDGHAVIRHKTGKMSDGLFDDLF